MKKKPRELRISWSRLQRLAAQLVCAIEGSGYKPDYVVGIAMGGLIPLALVAEGLKVKQVAAVAARSYDEKTKKPGKLVISHMPQLQARGKKILLIDEIVDTGQTFEIVSKVLKETSGAAQIKTAAIVVSATCKTPPDFFVMNADIWVVFPWEADARQ